MKRIKCLIVGSGGREASVIEKIKKECSIFAFMSHKNPGIIDAVKFSSGKYIVGDILDNKSICDFAQRNQIDIAFVSNDNVLEAGIVDSLKKVGIPTFGATRQGAKIEWSKTYALDVLDKTAPEFNIKTYKVNSDDYLKTVLSNYDNCDFVIKPEGLTSGKGVKIGNEHFHTQSEAYEYAHKCIQDSGTVLIQDIVRGEEFTLMGFTDGKEFILMPITCDYPYRFDGDKGPGTGGMGCFSYQNGKLPFLSDEDIKSCKDVMVKVLNYINKYSIEFTGVLYGGFIKCAEGIKIIEFNARFGDPECLNIMELLESSMFNIIKACIDGNLSKELCKFKDNAASIVVYLVSKNYGCDKEAELLHFKLNQEYIESRGAKVIYSSCARNSENLVSIGSSRLAAIVMSGESLSKVRKNVYQLINESVEGDVDYRRDIAKVYI